MSKNSLLKDAEDLVRRSLARGASGIAVNENDVRSAAQKIANSMPPYTGKTKR